MHLRMPAWVFSSYSSMRFVESTFWASIWSALGASLKTDRHQVSCVFSSVSTRHARSRPGLSSVQHDAPASMTSYQLPARDTAPPAMSSVSPRAEILQATSFAFVAAGTSIVTVVS